MKKVTAMLLTMLLICSVALTACGSKDEPTPDDGGTTARDTITVVNTAPIPDYDPVNWYITSQSTLFGNVYSALVDVYVNENYEVVVRPNLAKSWDKVDDTTWVFHLNENAVYSNGDKVTADHVKTCFERQMTNPYTQSYVSMIDSIEATDENTVTFHLKYAWPSIPNCWYMVAIYNVDLYDADKEGYIKNPVGSGPYELAELDETAGTMTLTLKEDWWGDSMPVIKTVNVKTITDPSTQVIALQKGEVDVCIFDGTNYALVKDDPNLKSAQSLSIVPWQLLLNKNVEPLNNDKLREAISYAINYEDIRGVTCAGYVSNSDNTIVFGTPEMLVPEGVQVYTYDPDKARELIAESGLQTPIDIGEIIGGNSNGSAEKVQKYLQDVGIEAKVTNYETNTNVEKFMSGEFSVAITTGVGGQSAFENLMSYYGTGQPYNFNRFSDPKVDEIISKMQVTSDEAETKALLEEALNIVVAEHTNMNLGVPARYVVYNKDFETVYYWNGVDMISVR